MISWKIVEPIMVDGEILKLRQGYCLSTDAKPTTGLIANGSTLIEMDTSKIYFYDAANTTWREFD